MIQLHHGADTGGAGTVVGVTSNFAELVGLWDGVMLASADRPLPAVVLERGTVLRLPAPQRAVEAAAERLGLVLPQSHAAFLAVSDGSYANGCGLVTRSGE